VNDYANDLKDQLKTLRNEFQSYSTGIPVHSPATSKDISCELDKILGL
jgi:hypothetical protein